MYKVKQEWFGPHLLSSSDDGGLSLSLVLDRNRCVSVVHVPESHRYRARARTIVAVQSFKPETEVILRTIEGRFSFQEGVKFALAVILTLELLTDDEVENFASGFGEPFGEMFPDTTAALEIASARAALATVRRAKDLRRTG